MTTPITTTTTSFPSAAPPPLDVAKAAQDIRAAANTGAFSTAGRMNIGVVALEFSNLQARDPELAAFVRDELTGTMSPTERRSFESSVGARNGENQSAVYARRSVSQTTAQDGTITTRASLEGGLYRGRAETEVRIGEADVTLGSQTTIAVAQARARGASGPGGAVLEGQASAIFAEQRVTGEVVHANGTRATGELTGTAGKAEAALAAHLGKVGCETGAAIEIKAAAVAAAVEGEGGVEFPVGDLTRYGDVIRDKPVVGAFADLLTEDTTLSMKMKGGGDAGALGAGAAAKAVLNTCTDRAEASMSAKLAVLLGIDADVSVGFGQPTKPAE